MADSTTNLDTIAYGDSSKESKANALFDAMSQNALFGRRAPATSALTWGYYGGKFPLPDGTIVSVPNGTVALTASATNYVYVDDTGAVQKVTAAPAGWPAPLADDAVALYEIVTGASSVTSYTDHRCALRGPAGPAGSGTPGQGVPAGGTDGQVLRKISSTNYDTAWEDSAFDVYAFYPGVMANAAVLLRVPVGRACTFPANFASSVGKASAAATGSTAIDVQKNGVSVGTITYAAAASTATFASTGGTAVSFAAGDVLSLHGPATADTTLADVGIVLLGART